MIKIAIKKLVNGKWHVYSESGKHMGGPYGTEAEANHRLQQIEYFKHQKTAASTYPISRTLGAFTLLNRPTYAKALVGRAATGGVLFPNEKKLVKQVPPNDHNRYPFAKLRTNPITSGIEGAAVGAFGYNVRKHVLPIAIETWQKALADPTALKGEKYVAKKLLAYVAKGMGIVGRDIIPADVVKLRNLNKKNLARMMGAIGLTSAGTTLADRLLYPRIVRGTAKLDKQTPETYIRSKLRDDPTIGKYAGFPVALMDDAAYYATKAVQALNPDPGPASKKKEPIKAVKKEIAETEKQGSLDMIMATKAIMNHPKIKPHLDKLVGEIKSIKDYGNAVSPTLGKVLSYPAVQIGVPGTMEGNIAQGLMGAHAREMGRNKKYYNAAMNVMKALPK